MGGCVYYIDDGKRNVDVYNLRDGTVKEIAGLGNCKCNNWPLPARFTEADFKNLDDMQYVGAYAPRF
uniref:DUF295 domain-containing protein n=1 Tax=Leersia perrieri TaxID=77586 RepID=A0A0D9W267_9ORYZ